MNFKNYYFIENKEEISNLKKELKKVESWFGTVPYKGNEDLFDKMEIKAKELRKKLYDLTGDPYGEIKKDKDKKKIKPKGLNDHYDSPEDVPVDVYKWIFSNSSLLTSDATDAVRWSRIINTKDDDRYDSELTVYRAVDDKSYDEIRPGDWVTTEEEYAIRHNEKYFNGDGYILSMNVDGKDVLVSPTGNSEEAIYAPLEYSIDVDL